MNLAFRRLNRRPILNWVKYVSQSQYFNSSLTKPETPPELDNSRTDYFAGQKLHGFTVEQVQDVPEFCLTAIRLSHDSTGADYLHIARDDHNNAFSVGFRTTPMDSTGAPHILEHTVLCGSEKYPCRDPFFKMLNRSLATFMNAFTGCDYTMYPFTTQNLKDFQNLMSVYLDAVFHPCLREMDFTQEGWRLEHKDIEDASSDIIFKGVVFNEMKGAFANSEQLFAQHLQNKLLPSHTYAFVSGGDPVFIPDLSIEALRKFHGIYYHPSNARFYTYGDFPLEGHLMQINELLQKFMKSSVNTSVPLEKHWDNSRQDHIRCRPDPLLPNPEKNTTVCMSYLLHDITDISETLTMQILSELLVSGPNSPFYKNLLAPQIGSNYAPVVGIDCSLKEAVFSIGLQGIHENDVSKVTSIIESTFDEVIRTGFSNERIEAILHRIELSMKHVSTSFGLHLCMGLMPTWIHDGDPLRALQIQNRINIFRRNIKDDPTFLQKKIKKYFKENNHRMTLIMSPDPEYETNQNNQEQEKLSQTIKLLSHNEKKGIFEKGLKLASKQNQDEDLSCLPSLKIEDIDRTIPFTNLNNYHLDGTPIQMTVQPTNGVTYFRGVMDTSSLSADLKPFLPLFCNVLTNLGAGAMDYKQLAQEIELKTGGLQVSTHIVDSPTDFNRYEEGIQLYSHCLDQNSEDMFHLWNEIFNGAKFEEKERLATLIGVLVSDMVAQLPDIGHSYAITQASSTLSTAAHLREQYSGMKQIKELRKLVEEANLNAVVEKFRSITQHILKTNRFRFALNTSSSSMSNAQKNLDKFTTKIQKYSEKTSSSNALNIQSQSNHQYYVLPFPVHYISKCIPGVPLTHQDYASLKILAHVMTNKFLHREIREKGGAYGGGAMHGTSGIFTFYSYRDPNSLQTLETFDQSIQWILRGQFTEEHVDEAKLNAFQQVDKPVAPGDRGALTFLNGVSDQMLQRHREQLFKVRRDDIIAVATKYLVRPDVVSACILGPENINLKSDHHWKIITDYKEL